MHLHGPPTDISRALGRFEIIVVLCGLLVGAQHPSASQAAVICKTHRPGTQRYLPPLDIRTNLSSAVTAVPERSNIYHHCIRANLSYIYIYIYVVTAVFAECSSNIYHPWIRADRSIIRDHAAVPECSSIYHHWIRAINLSSVVLLSQQRSLCRPLA